MCISSRSDAQRRDIQNQDVCHSSPTTAPFPSTPPTYHTWHIWLVGCPKVWCQYNLWESVWKKHKSCRVWRLCMVSWKCAGSSHIACPPIWPGGRSQRVRLKNCPRRHGWIPFMYLCKRFEQLAWWWSYQWVWFYQSQLPLLSCEQMLSRKWTIVRKSQCHGKDPCRPVHQKYGNMWGQYCRSKTVNDPWQRLVPQSSTFIVQGWISPEQPVSNCSQPDSGVKLEVTL